MLRNVLKLKSMHRIKPFDSYSKSMRNFASKKSNTKSLNADNLRLSTLNTHSHNLAVSWQDGFQSKFHYIWLRDNCVCKECVSSSGQKLIARDQLPSNPKPTSITIRNPNVEVVWDDGHKSSFDSNFLRENSYSDSESENPNLLPDPSLWSSSDLSSGIPEMKFEEIMDNEKKLWEWVYLLHSVGVVIIKNVPRVKTSVKKVAEKIAYLRNTMYGETWDVIAVPDPINVAYTNIPLELHQDLMYYESPPGLQFLHCLHAKAEGGANYFVDGFKAAELFREKNEELFQALTKNPATYHKRGKDHWLYYRRPIIDTNPHSGKVQGVYIAPQFEGPLRLPFNQTEIFYEAFRQFSQLLKESSMRVYNRLEEGDCVSFQNRRILHAREPYDLKGGKRHLRGAYVDLDEFENKYRVLFQKYGKLDLNKEQK